MTRSRRVRQMTSDELASELASLLLDSMISGELSEGKANRWERVARELARRDYRFRPHGKDCCCHDCWTLFGTWQNLQRRASLMTFDPYA